MSKTKINGREGEIRTSITHSKSRTTAFAILPENTNTRRFSNFEKRRQRLSSFAIIHDMKVFGLPKKTDMCKRYRHRINFSSGSNYEGEWDNMGFSGEGDYNYPHGINYKGEFFDGLFDDYGTLSYPKGQLYFDWFCHGGNQMKSFEYRFADGLSYQTPWNYCQMPDRRFHITINNGFRPAGHEYITNSETPRVIPEGCYDTGDGFFDPKLKVVFSALDRQRILRIPTPSEEQWIVDNCRKAWDEPTRYRPDLYEQWMSGRSSETYNMPGENEDSQPGSDSERSDMRQNSKASDLISKMTMDSMQDF